MIRTLTLLVLSVVLSTLVIGQVSLKEFMLHDDTKSAWLGVVIRDAPKDAGAVVTEVVEDSPAREAGLLEDDVIVVFDGRDIEDTDDLIRAVRRSDPGEEVTITIDRDGKAKTVTAELRNTRRPKAFTWRIPDVPRVAPRPHLRDIFGPTRVYGLEVQDLEKQLAEYFEVPGNRGVLVTSVKRGSVGDEAGLKAGDVIIRVNGTTVSDRADLMHELSDAEEGEVPVDVVRKGRERTIKLPVEDDTSRHDMSFYFHDGKGPIFGEGRGGRYRLRPEKEFLDELSEGLRELKEELRDGAKHIREAVRRELRNL